MKPFAPSRMSFVAASDCWAVVAGKASARGVVVAAVAGATGGSAMRTKMKKARQTKWLLKDEGGVSVSAILPQDQDETETTSSS